MTTVTWPADRAFGTRACSVGAFTAKSRFAGFFDGHSQTLAHNANRLLFTLTLPPCNAADGARREAFFLSLTTSGDWVRLAHPHRSEPRGTMRGTPVVETAALAAARTLRIQGIAGDTLEAGDVLGVDGQLLIVGYAGAVANGSGLLIVPLAVPLRAAIDDVEAVTWQAPTTTFELLTDTAELDYGRGAWQREIELAFGEAF